MIVSASHDGHGTYGLRVLGDARGLWFRPEWRWITLLLPGDLRPACLRVAPGFWGTSPELRSARVRGFLDRENLLTWPADQPPHFELEPLGGGVFRLGWIERRHRQLPNCPES